MPDRVEVFTFKEGLLARLAHDLVLEVGAFEVKRTGADAFEVTVRADSLRAKGAIRDGRPDDRTLSRKDLADIDAHTRKDVLHPDRYPLIRFRGRLVASRVEGELDLHGRVRPLAFPVTYTGGRVRGEVEFAPSRWGIPPFSALLGAMRIQDRVRVAFDVSVPSEG
ncbi:MAG: YceI family protein [Deltaproteobacteria bacterium]|nr:YceI family protein [Deltaproteobacteria bacterium]